MGSNDTRRLIAERAARELRHGEVVNLGVGIPSLIPAFLPRDAGVFLHSENGILGVGPRPDVDAQDPDLIDAGKQPVTALPGASYFDSSDSFAMIRGGHLDVAVLGALQVSRTGDIANWAVPGRDVLGVGGAMDLVVGAKRVIVTMTATSSSGQAKIVEQCAYPLTARAAADVVITERAVYRLRDGELVMTEVLADSLEQALAATECALTVDLE